MNCMSEDLFTWSDHSSNDHKTNGNIYTADRCKVKHSLFNQPDEGTAECQTAGYLETSRHSIAQFLI